MNVAVVGTGMVGSAIASRLVGLGHEVKMGSREAGNEKAREWADEAGPKASEGSFADAAAFGELVFNCTAGEHSIAALRMAGAPNLAGKVLIDVANVLDFSGGRPPAVGVGTKDSLGEQIQRTFPDAKVVKALNTMNCDVMVDPTKVPANTTSSSAARTPTPRLRLPECCESSGGRPSTSSTSAVSARLAGPNCM